MLSGGVSSCWHRSTGRCGRVGHVLSCTGTRHETTALLLHRMLWFSLALAICTQTFKEICVYSLQATRIPCWDLSKFIPQLKYQEILLLTALPWAAKTALRSQGQELVGGTGQGSSASPPCQKNPAEELAGLRLRRLHTLGKPYICLLQMSP